MLLTIAISLLYVEIKEAAFKKIFSQILQNFWSEWELRLMLIVSLILQFLLVYFGRKRENYQGKWVPAISISAWLIYLSADWMATLVLSTLLRGSTELKNELVVFWTPFLLWHLGSPANITAYSLEDNELWLRHFFGMVFQIGEAIYICIKFRSNTEMNALAIPLFIAGAFRYGERIWALRCASPKQLINFFYSSSTSTNPNEENVGGKMKEMIRTGLYDRSKRRDFLEANIPSEVKFLREAYSSFEIFLPLFSDLPFQISEEFHNEMIYLKSRPTEEAFNFVEIQLEFLYDVFYTKNHMQHRRYLWSLILRILCLCFVLSVLIAFLVLQHKIHPCKTDFVVTYSLLFGALYLEIHSFYMHLRSKWTMLRHAVPRDKVHKLYYWLTSYRLRSIKSRKGIRKLAQHDLIDYCVKSKSNWFNPIIKLIDTGNLLQRFGHTKWKPVNSELKEFIYSHLKAKHAEFRNSEFKHECLDKLLGDKGDNVIKGRGLSLDDEYWKLESTDFTRRIFVWHIATSFVYYDDRVKHRISGSNIVRIAKSLSDYMMHLVLVRPTMLPNGFSEMVNKETLNQSERFFPQSRVQISLEMSMEAFIAALLSRDNSTDECFETGALMDGVKFAKQLQGLRNELRWDDDEKWKLICDVWMEMMVFAASRCTWEEHAQQLRHGGELLTHVSLLMAHLGLSTQVHRFELPQSHHSEEMPFPYPF